MKKISLAIALVASAFMAQAQTAQDVFNKFFDATGGKDNWEKVSVYTNKQSYKTNAPTDFDLETNISVGESSISRKKSILQRDFFYVTKGNEGWLKIPMGSLDKAMKYDVKTLSDKEKTAMQQEIKDGVYPFLNFEQKGYTATLVGTEKLNNADVVHVTLTGNGTKHDYYFDANTGLLSKDVETNSAETLTWEHKNYAKAANGLSYPSESVYTSSKDKKNVNVKTEITFKDKLDPVLFVR